jgi:hypothetical protein
MISLNVATMRLKNTKFLGNFAKSGTNGMQLINSKVYMDNNCLIDNSRNIHKFPDQFRVNIPYGFINMNYESKLNMTDVTINNLSGIKASFAYSAGQSDLLIKDSKITDCVGIDSSIYITSPNLVELDNMTFSTSSGLWIEYMYKSKFLI